MAEKKITCTVSDDGQGVTLSGQGDAHPPLTFFVTRSDSLRWDFGNVPEGGRTRVEFSSFEPEAPGDTAGEAQLFGANDSSKEKSEKAGSDRKTRIVSGLVRGPSRPGKYFYKVFLTDETGEHELQCFWDGHATLMGGGEKSGKPVPLAT